MAEKIKIILFWLVFVLILVGCNRILSYPNASVNYDYMDEETQEELNEEMRQNFIDDQLF